MTITKTSVDFNKPYYLDIGDTNMFSLDELKTIYQKLDEFLKAENIIPTPETRCDKCVYEMACQSDRCIYPSQRCTHYKRDAKDGGYYG